MSKYKKINSPNLWIDEDFEGISYTDGSNVEQHLLESLKSANDLSALSEELIPHIIDWPSEYHFSRNRHCLLRPLEIKEGDRVLELGCGCGALTRYLGETGADVVSVEGRLKRAEIAAERCRDLKNVNIVCENLLSFSLEDLNFLSEGKFDLVLLIGVIEYAPAFSDAEFPIKSYLDKAGTFLKDSGKLIIAIENKIGLKYFNGCTEDHIGEHFYGLNDLYDSKSAVTFGRKELVNQLGLSGFAHTFFYYPFPDYKLPTTILKDEAFELEYFNESQLLIRMESRDYIGKKNQLFSDPLVSKVFSQNGILKDVSNSFLVVTAKQKISDADPETIAWNYSIGQRRLKYCTETSFKNINGKITTNKVYLSSPDVKGPQESTEPLQIIHKIGSEPYFNGNLTHWEIQKACLKSDDIESISNSFTQWFAALKEQATLIPGGKKERLSSWKISGDMIDATPFNCIYGKPEFHFFDKEWSHQSDISLGFVLYRSVFWSLSCCLFRSPGKLRISDVIDGICKIHDLEFDHSQMEQWYKEEVTFQEIVSSRSNLKFPPFITKKSSVLWKLSKYEAMIQQFKEFTDKNNQNQKTIAEQRKRLADQEAYIENLNIHLNSIYKSKSWLLTKPLRFLTRSFRRIF